MTVPYPIICLLGDRGAGKTVFGVYTIEQALKEKVNIYTNIETNFKSKFIKPIDFEAIKENPELIENGYLIMDEMHVGSDSYEFMSKNNRELSQFATQIRKRKITWIYITQRFGRIDKRLREQTNYIYEIKGLYNKVYQNNKLNLEYNHSIISIFEIVDIGNYNLIRKFQFNGRKYFDMYNTNQLILRKAE